MLRPLTRTLGVVLLLSATLAPQYSFAAPGAPINRVTNGGFETGYLSLSLPNVSRFPLVVNGWAARGLPIPGVIADPQAAYEGVHALHLASAPRSPVQVLQDLPLSFTSYRLELAFQRRRGTQVIRLLSSWDRGDPGHGEVVIAVALTASGIEVTTTEGAWSMEHDLVAGRWHWLEVVSDARTGVQTVTVDGAASMSLPGTPSNPPQTLLLGGVVGSGSSDYLYDSIWLAQLPEAELVALRAEVSRSATLSRTSGLASRLDAAATALARGSAILALSELEAARRLLGADAVREASLAAGDGDSTQRARIALAALIDLLKSWQPAS